MSDKMPNYFVEQQRLKADIAGQKANIAKQYLDIMEMADRKQRLLDNIEAAKLAVKDKMDRLKGLEQEHGALSPDEFDKTIGEI